MTAIAAAMPLPSFAQEALKDDSPTNSHESDRKLRLRFTPYELRLRHAFNLATMSRTTTPGVQVAIDFNGTTGYGEASMPPYLGESVESVTQFLGLLDLSRFDSPFLIEDIAAYMDDVAPGNCAAKAAVDIALHDLMGKLTGQSCCRLMGLNPMTMPLTSYTISNDTPEIVQQKIEEAAPYKILKVKMGVEGDRELIETIRRATDRQICVDANQGWKSRQEALDTCKWLADRNVMFVEQPMNRDDIESHHWLRERSPLPIVADESLQRHADLHRLRGAFDGINIKLMKCGGMREAYAMAKTARSMGMKVMLGCMTETSCAVSAAAQLAPLADWADLDGNLLIANDTFDGAKIVDGRVTIFADRPGLGLTPLSSHPLA